LKLAKTSAGFLNLVLILAAGAVLVLVLSSCSGPTKRVEQKSFLDSITGGAVRELPKETTPSETLCDEKECSENEICVEGECACKEGYKECRGECIERDACCTDGDCGEGHKCVQGSCEASCYDIECDSNKVCGENNNCVCPEETTWCAFQEKCIPFNACCTGADCKGSEDCVLTGESINVCLSYDSQEECKRVKLGSSQTLGEGENTHVVGFIKSMPGNRFGLKIDFRERTLIKGEQSKISPSASLFVKDHFVFGGNCE